MLIHVVLKPVQNNMKQEKKIINEYINI